MPDGLFKPIRTRRTFEEAVEQIARAISSNELRVGDRLPAERVLATQMAVSRPTIREALKVLADAGVIEIVGNGRGGGAYVRSDFVPANLLEEHANLRVGEVTGVLVTRRLLEPRVAQLAAIHATEADFDRIQRTIDLQAGALGERSRFLALDMRFHLQVAQAAHNGTIEALMRVLVRRLEMVQDLALRNKAEAAWETALRDHARVLEAIGSRDPVAAETRLIEHLAILEDAWTEESGWSFHTTLPDFLQRRALDASAAAS